jgi:hypothetical protein
MVHARLDASGAACTHINLVDFFSLEGERLGSKLLLEAIIHDITGIPRAALRGQPLEGFSHDKRMS